jgi:FkbM family methyltransferase
MLSHLQEKIYKITWRIKFMRKAFVPALQAFFQEKNNQPWEYIFDYWFLPASKRYLKTRYYLENKKLPGIILVNKKIIVNNYTVDISTAPHGESFLLGVIAEYFDFIYPKQVKYPIPFFISEGPYEKGGCVIKKNDVVIDAGANLGLFSWLIKKDIGEDGKIYMFEPISSLSTILKESITTNDTSSTMSVIESAVSDEDGYTCFSVQDFGGGSHKSETGTTKIQTIKIDTYVKNNNIPRIDFIKADIEGMEPFLIRGAHEIIHRDKPRLAICTYHDINHRKELTELIKSIRPDYQFEYSSHKLFAW